MNDSYAGRLVRAIEAMLQQMQAQTIALNNINNKLEQIRAIQQSKD